mmetsp:Transcript_15581/g.25806  ORF Transcript_15581/g.25806 Transcript_15581/m.25806 type:complete len:469 (+) Transcript_15581:30-1436(+)
MNDEEFSSLPDWKDADRTAFLYGPFWDREKNPDMWADKINFWTRAVAAFCRRKSMVFSLEELREAFRREGHYPLCLQRVLAELESNGHVNPLDTLLNSDQDIGWTSWLLSKAVIAPAAWTFSQVFALGSKATSGDILESEELAVPKAALKKEYVHMDVLKERADLVYSWLTDPEHGHVEHPELMSDIVEVAKRRGHALSTRDIELIGSYLVNSRQAAQFQLESGEKVLKVALPGKRRVTVTDVDRGIARMKITSRVLERQVLKLESSVADLTSRAQVAATSKRREEAKRHLAMRRKVTEMLDARRKALNTLSEIHTKIEETHVNSKIIDAYREGTQALRAATVGAGLTAEKVDDVMLGLQEALADQKEIDDALSHGGIAEEADETGLLAELESLEAEVKEEEAQQTNANEEILPSPSFVMTSDTIEVKPLPTSTHRTPVKETEKVNASPEIRTKGSEPRRTSREALLA